MNSIISSIEPFLPFIVTTAVVTLLLWLAHKFIIARRPELGNEKLFSRQLLMLGLTFAGILAIVFSLPIKNSSLNQVLALFGLVISGIIAFSSSTIFVNIMSGLMLRVTKSFTTGDFINVREFFGRVVQRGLLDTEIQTENRELVSIPNSFMITNPISVTNVSGAIVSTQLSLGYDIHHTVVESLLLDAAQKCELQDPFIQVLELGDYSVTYKVSGVLTDVKSLLTSRSELCRFILDSIHGSGHEILSPSFMAQRRTDESAKIIPDKIHYQPIIQQSKAEDVVFDLAEKAEQVETAKQGLILRIEEYKSLLTTSPNEEKKSIKQIISRIQDQLKVYEEFDAGEAEKENSKEVSQ